MATRIRLDPDQRKELILTAALQVAAERGYLFMTRDEVASRIGCSPALIPKYFGSIDKFRKTVLRLAIKQEVLEVIVQGLAAKDPLCAKLPDDVKKRAAATLLTKG